MIILLINNKNIFYILLQILKVLLFWDIIIDINKKYNYTEKILYIIC